jgi:long-chain fatty acid transport protein
VGIIYKPIKQLSIALDYRSQTTLRMRHGTAEFTVPSALADSFPKTQFTSQLKLPQMLTLGLAYTIAEKATIVFDVNFTGWKCYDTLRFDYAFNSQSLEDTKIIKNYKNAFSFRLGAQYKFADFITVRIGGFYDMTPVQDGFLFPDGPDANRIGGSAGISLYPGKHFNIDLSYMYLETAKRTGGSNEVGFWGTYKIKAAIPTIGLQYTF